MPGMSLDNIPAPVKTKKAIITTGADILNAIEKLLPMMSIIEEVKSPTLIKTPGCNV